MCYIWLESYGCVDSHYQLLNNVPGTRLAPDFCQQFGTQIITPSETLSYANFQRRTTSNIDSVRVLSDTGGMRSIRSSMKFLRFDI